jgi:hypothetical protein
MTGSAPDPKIAERMRALAAGLTAAGVDAHVHETRGVLDITSTAHRAGGKEIEVICDEDLYVQIGYWHDPGATPEEVIARICRVLSAITGPPGRGLAGQRHA